MLPVFITAALAILRVALPSWDGSRLLFSPSGCPLFHPRRPQLLEISPRQPGDREGVSHASNHTNHPGLHQLNLQRSEGGAECAAEARVTALETLLPAPGLEFEEKAEGRMKKAEF
jgi:hypothetical protein